MSRTPDQRVYSSGSYRAYGFGQCYVSLGAPDSDDFAFTKCDDEGNFEFTNIPTGNLRVTVFDQWNDLLVDGLSTSIKGRRPPVSAAAQATAWKFPSRNGGRISPAVSSSTRAVTGSRRTTSPACRWRRTTSATATAATWASTTPIWPATRDSTKSSRS